jgi:hypothetical protein
VRRYLTISTLLTTALLLSACGGNSNTSVNAGRADDETPVNSERIEGSNMAPTGGPGPEPESGGVKSSGNTNENKDESKDGNKEGNKNKADNNKNKNKP